MHRPRLIARLDIKGDRLIKGVQFEGLRVIGDPWEYALRYAAEADELLYIDTVATLYGRNQLESLIEKVSEKVFIPITVGGGIRSVDGAGQLFRCGADKVAINSAAIGQPRLITQCADRFGSQAICVSIEAKRGAHGWEAYTDNGRERSGRDAVEWAKDAVQRGAGELLVTSIDRDGTCRGFDAALIAAIAPHVPVPVIASGGMGSVEHLLDVLEVGRADAVAMASCLHSGRVSFGAMREAIEPAPAVT